MINSKSPNLLKIPENLLCPQSALPHICTGCPRKRFLLGFDLISANGCCTRNQDTIHVKPIMISFKISGQ